MHLIQILLPLYGKEGRRIAPALFQATARELAREYGGVTAYTRSPAQGLWRRRRGRFERDDIVVFEVMVQRLSRRNWAGWRRTLTKRFRQHEIVVRGLACSVL